MIDNITINGADVQLHWGESADGHSVGLAISLCPPGSTGEVGPMDGDVFEFGGKRYELGQHDYSTDQPGHEHDNECVCSAKIYPVEN